LNKPAGVIFNSCNAKGVYFSVENGAFVLFAVFIYSIIFFLIETCITIFPKKR